MKSKIELKTEDILSISLRPRTLSELYGQDVLIKSIRSHMTKRPPRNWLLSGEPGTGKTTLAWIMAVSLQCEHMKVWGDPCPECWKNRYNFAIHEINASEHSGVDELESVVKLSVHRPMTGLKRVIILDEVHAISKTAFSMLLKPTEEPPPFTVWILCTSDAKKVPAANQRRSVKYKLKTLGIDESEDFLKKQAVKASITRSLNELFEAVHTMSIGSPGVLLQALEKYGAGTSASEAVADAGGTGVDAYSICKALTNGNWNSVKAILKNSNPEDSRWIRAVVSGWMKGCLIRSSMSADGEKASQSLIDLCSAPFDESMMIHWLHGVLFKICKRYAR